MKKIILSLLVVFAAVQFASAAKSTEQRVAEINKQVGGTLTEEQIAKATELFDAAAEAVTNGSRPAPAYRTATKGIADLLTEEQVGSRNEYLETLKAAAEE